MTQCFPLLLKGGTIMGFGGSCGGFGGGFALIIVLFILLIIVGAACFC
ncbi:sporulation protein YjcZ [Bacillus pseudomycoides]|nr:sporulation protein YjcZ [Bacillus pseudomycoides]